MQSAAPTDRTARPLRWWPAWVLGALLALIVLVIRLRADLPYQSRNLATMEVLLVGAALFWLWWLLFSRAPWRWRLLVCGGVAAAAGLGAGVFRIRGVSGDLLPIFEPRWAVSGVTLVARQAVVVAGSTNPVPAIVPAAIPDFPQFLGPTRDCMLAGPALDADWSKRPPQILWRQPIGAAWSGFAVVGERAITQEQAGEQELVTCYDVATGRRVWQHADAAHFNTTIAGEGPRATPTVVSNRVVTLGATGILNCLDLADGRLLWQRQITSDAPSTMPGWGFAGSPLVFEGKVIVSAGGGDNRSLLAYRFGDGELVWTGGSASASYSSPMPLTLAGVPQIVMFNSRRITAHAPNTGAVLWEYPWGVGQPHVAMPVAIGSNRVVFSSGYGVGAELLELASDALGHLAAQRIWKSPRLKAKFANFIAHDGFLYGLDDGVLACVDLHDGAQRWREGRYGHGQMLRLGSLVLLTAENGELVLLEPTPQAANERHRFRVFSGKTWNPPALSGDRLLVRTDQEAACVRLALETPKG